MYCHAGHVSLGALGDSFYEYLLKSWLMTSKHDVEARDMYYESLSPIMKHLVKHTSSGLTFITDMKNGRADSKMQHLVSEGAPVIKRANFTFHVHGRTPDALYTVFFYVYLFTSCTCVL